ncbi:MAG: hypothetical protein ABIB43_00530 [archaeon]
MPHRGIETHLAETCTNCGIDHDQKFTSKFDPYSTFTHYLTKICDCGYEIHFRVTDGSGIR